MEDLTKHQLILLVILITFITSIGTGIITFTLLSEAPVAVTQNINRIVEKTIERVVTEEGKPEKIVTTVVVNEEDRILETIAKNEKSLVRLKTISSDGTEVIAGLGLVVSSDGTIVYHLSNYNNSSSYSVTFHDGKNYPTSKVYLDNENNLVFLKINIPKNDTSKYVFYPAVFGNSDLLKIGQTLVAVSGQVSNAVTIGRVRQLIFNEDKKIIKSLISDIPILKSYSGSPVLNLSGEVIGLESPSFEGATHYSYFSANIVKSATPKALAELSK